MKMKNRYMKVFLTSLVLSLVYAVILSRFLPIFLYTSFLAPSFGFLSTLIYFSKREWRKDSIEKKLLYNLLATILVMNFLQTIPINIDRSFSVWMLTQIEYAGSANKIQLQDIENDAQQFLAPENGEIRRRIHEQVSIGNIRVESGMLNLTKRGQMMVKFNRAIANIFNLNPKYSSSD